VAQKWWVGTSSLARVSMLLTSVGLRRRAAIIPSIRETEMTFDSGRFRPNPDDCIMEARIMDPRSMIVHLVVCDAVRVEADLTLAQVALAMQDARVSAVLVGTSGAIATERDVVRGLARGLGTDEPVSSIATPRAIRVSSHMSVIDATALMLNEEVRHLVVELDGGNEGVVSLRDLMAVLLQAASPDIWLTSLRVAVSTPAEIWLG
jgi:CBS domain-containing protein